MPPTIPVHPLARSMTKPGRTIPMATANAAPGVRSSARMTAETTISPIDSWSVNRNRGSRMAHVLGPRPDRGVAGISGEDPVHINAPAGNQGFRIDHLPAPEGRRLIGRLGPIDMDALADRIDVPDDPRPGFEIIRALGSE